MKNSENNVLKASVFIENKIKVISKSNMNHFNSAAYVTSDQTDRNI